VKGCEVPNKCVGQAARLELWRRVLHPLTALLLVSG
jgi:hypothetical protein